MREKTDASKLRDGRGILNGDIYEAWKTAREAKSIGTASAVYDPIQRRTVNLLSVGESKVFWVLRFLTTGRILEQYPMDRAGVDAACDALGIRRYSKILSTDFLVEQPNGGAVAISVKPHASVFSEDTHNYQRNVNRHNVEARYWELRGVPHHLIYSDTIGIDYVGNIKDVMRFWDDMWVRGDPANMLMHMIAHHVIQIPLDQGRLPFKVIAQQIKVEDMYETYQRYKDDPDFRGWIIDLPRRHAIPCAQSPSFDQPDNQHVILAD